MYDLTFKYSACLEVMGKFPRQLFKVRSFPEIVPVTSLIKKTLSGDSHESEPFLLQLFRFLQVTLNPMVMCLRTEFWRWRICGDLRLFLAQESCVEIENNFTQLYPICPQSSYCEHLTGFLSYRTLTANYFPLAKVTRSPFVLPKWVHRVK